MNKSDKSPPENGSETPANGVGPKHLAKADAIRPKPKRFYKSVTVKPEGNRFAILLDGKPIKTPVRQNFSVLSAPLAEAIAEEWDSQQEHIDHETMVHTKLANTAIDRVAARREEIIAEISNYAGSDLILYRADQPASLIAREQQNWDPFLQWLKRTHNITLTPATGIIHVPQDQAELDKIEALYQPFDEFALTALHNMTSLTGSAILPLALVSTAEADKDAWKPDDIWTAAHTDEDFQIERWGSDEEAARRRKLKHQEFLKTHEFFCLSRPDSA